MLQPIGRSVYNALQASFRQDVNHPLPGIRHANLIVSYAYSRFSAVGAASNDIDFSGGAFDNNNPLRYFGPGSLDRPHQLSFGGVIDLPLGFRASTTAHFNSALPQNLTLPTTGTADIFKNDLTGDGTAGDILPGTNIGPLAGMSRPGRSTTKSPASTTVLREHLRRPARL